MAKKTTKKKAAKKKAPKKEVVEEVVETPVVVETVELPEPRLPRGLNLNDRRKIWAQWHEATGKPIPAAWRKL